jgi:two-component system, LytTR family, response regulator
MKVLVVDDERRARDRLKRMLSAFPQIEISGEAEDGLKALEAIQAHRPDAVFLDVQMPGLSGFDVLAELPAAGRPLIVFVTAYEEYAVRAFQVSAVDYLMKPVEKERLSEAVARLEDRSSPSGIEKLLAALHSGPPLQRIVGKRLQKLHVLPVETIVAFTAKEQLVFAVTAEGRFLVSATLRDLEARLNRDCFARVHKQTIINLTKIAELEPMVKGGAVARLANGETIEISRRYARGFRERLGF